MSKKNDIPNESVGDTKMPLHDFDDAYVGRPDSDFLNYEPKKKFKDTAFGRTILLKNKTGKTIAGVIGAAIGIFTGVDITPIINTVTGGNEMDFLFNAGLIEIAIYIVTFLLVSGVSWLGAYYKLPGKFTDKITQFIEIAADEIEKATHEESDKGRKITRTEIKNALINSFVRVFKKAPKELKSAKIE